MYLPLNGLKSDAAIKTAIQALSVELDENSAFQEALQWSPSQCFQWLLMHCTSAEYHLDANAQKPY